MAFITYIEEYKLNNYYYIKQYLITYQIYLQLIKIINSKTNGFILKNFDTELNKQLILFKPPVDKEYDVNIYFRDMENNLPSNNNDELPYTFYKSFFELFLENSFIKQQEIQKKHIQ
jgi:hypothetical protein